MKPREKFGDEFVHQPFTFTKSDGTEHECHDICVCITPKEDASTTLAYAWEVFRDVASWACEEFKDRPTDETYRIVIAWSESVGAPHRHILKIWCDLSGVRERVTCETPEEVSAQFGSRMMPFAHWKTGVFTQKS